MPDNFIMPPVSEVKSKDQAEELAKDWQRHTAESSQSYGELAADAAYFEILGRKFGLMRVFKENGII